MHLKPFSIKNSQSQSPKARKAKALKLKPLQNTMSSPSSDSLP